MDTRRSSLLVAFFLLLVSTIAGQSRLECGQVQSNELSIPSFKFVVVDENGKQFDKLRATAGVEMRTWVWGHSYGDWNWEDENRFVSIPITFDRKDGVYVTKAIPNLKIKDTGSKEYPCLDRLRRFYVGFTLGDFSEKSGFAGGFSLNLWKKSREEISFPDSSEPIKITLKGWGGVREP